MQIVSKSLSPILWNFSNFMLSAAHWARPTHQSEHCECINSSKLRFNLQSSEQSIIEYLYRILFINPRHTISYSKIKLRITIYFFIWSCLFYFKLPFSTVNLQVFLSNNVQYEKAMIYNWQIPSEQISLLLSLSLSLSLPSLFQSNLAGLKSTINVAFIIPVLFQHWESQYPLYKTKIHYRKTALAACILYTRDA